MHALEKSKQHRVDGAAPLIFNFLASGSIIIMKKATKLCVIPFFIFSVSLLIGLLIINNYRNLRENEQRHLISDIVAAQAATIERHLSRTLSATYFLKSLLEINPEEMAHFDNYAANIIESLGGITNLQLAPNGIISNIYPLKGHEKALGHNLLVDDKHKEDAKLALSSKQLTLSGPFELIQGGMAIVGRNPVFLKGEDNAEQFWGFASVVIYLNDLLTTTGLDQLKDKGYYYQLSFNDNYSKSNYDLSESHRNTEPLSSMIKQAIKVPNGEWLLSMKPVIQTGQQVAITIRVLLALSISALMAYFSYVLLKQPLILKRLVIKKTEELNKLAFYDPLTDLCNRRLFNDLLKRMVTRIQRDGNQFALLYLDIDEFKRINDTLGHEAGDELLKVVGLRLSNALRKSDTVARLGGDEFCIILPDINTSTNAARVAEKIKEAIRPPVKLGEHEVRITISIGITLAPNDGLDATELLKNTDLAMYSAKEKNRDCYQFFSPTLNADMLEQIVLEQDLRQALEHNEFTLHFQPQICLFTGEISGIEALVRWHHPDKGLLYPGGFIQQAEDSGLILPLGSWVIKQACHQLDQLNRPELTLSVNLSTRQLADPNLLQTIQFALTDSGIEPHRLELEITETALMEKMEQAIEILNKIKMLGVTIAIDDFGTGYSSLSQLKNLPVDILKIDREFIQDITTRADNAVITDVIISVGHKLGLTVVAEGIETKEQAAYLTAMGCDMAQGYFFNRPMDMAALQNLLKIQSEETAPSTSVVDG